MTVWKKILVIRQIFFTKKLQGTVNLHYQKLMIKQTLSNLCEGFVELQVLGQGLGVNFTFAW